MSGELARAWVLVRGDVSHLPGDLDKARPMVDRAMGAMGGRISGWLSALVGGFSLYKIMGEANTAIAEARKAIGAEARLDAIWHSTGNAIEQTQEELKAYANEMSKVTQFDGAELTNAMASLLSYTSLSYDELKKVLEVTMDVSAAWGTSLVPTTESLAKILANPLGTKGLGQLLSSKGFFITPQQKKDLADLQKAGDEAGAKAVIMDVLSGQEGAARRLFAGQGEAGKMRKEMEEISETLGRKLIPIQNKWNELLMQSRLLMVKIIDAVAPLIDNLLDLNKSWGGLPFKIMLASAALITFWGVVKLVQFTGIITDIYRLGKAFIFLGISIKALSWGTLGIGLLLVTGLVAGLVMWLKQVSFADIMDGLDILTTNWSLTWQYLRVTAKLVFFDMVAAGEWFIKYTIGGFIGFSAAVISIIFDLAGSLWEIFKTLGSVVQGMFVALWEGIKAQFTGGSFWDGVNAEWIRQVDQLTTNFPDIGKNAAAAFNEGLKTTGVGGPSIFQDQINELSKAREQLWQQMKAERKAKDDATVPGAGGPGAPGAGAGGPGAAAAVTAAALETGRYSFKGLGDSMQDMLMKQDKDKHENRMEGFAEQNINLQQQLLEAVENNNRNLGLAAD